jgi:Co/Zn/Cd efflux system component
MEDASVHLMTEESVDPHPVLDTARTKFHDDYGIDHATFQVESKPHTNCDQVPW